MDLERIKRLFENRTVRIVLILLLALALVLATFAVFGGEEGYTPSEAEARTARLIERLDEVSRAAVAVTEEGGKAVSAVVVFRGEDGILTRMRILEIAAGALHLPKSAVSVYPEHA